MLGDLPPVIVIDHFLGGVAAERLLQYAITRESGFRPSKVALRHEGIIDESRRVSKVNSDTDAAMPLIEPAIRKAVDEAIPKLGLVNVESYSLEPELTWCGDGGFFKTHVDTLYRDRSAKQRVMTVVYYFYRSRRRLQEVNYVFTAWELTQTAPASRRSSHNSTGQCFSRRGFRMRCCLFIPAALHLRTGGLDQLLGTKSFGGDQHYGNQRH